MAADKTPAIELFHRHGRSVRRDDGSPWDEGQDTFVAYSDKEIRILPGHDLRYDCGTAIRLPRGLILLKTPMWNFYGLILLEAAPIIGVGAILPIEVHLRNRSRNVKTIHANSPILRLAFLRTAAVQGCMLYPLRSEILPFSGRTATPSQQEQLVARYQRTKSRSGTGTTSANAPFSFAAEGEADYRDLRADQDAEQASRTGQEVTAENRARAKLAKALTMVTNAAQHLLDPEDMAGASDLPRHQEVDLPSTGARRKDVSGRSCPRSER